MLLVVPCLISLMLRYKLGPLLIVSNHAFLPEKLIGFPDYCFKMR